MKINTIIIDDRRSRQERYKDIVRQLDKYNSVKNVVDAIEIEDIKISLQENDFNLCFEHFDNIMIHKSMLEKQQIKNLENFCVSTKKKSVVFFSGSVSQSIIKKEKSTFIIHINSNSFYSDNLLYFLDDKDIDNVDNIYKLLYGKKYESNRLINLLDRLTFFISQYKNEMKYNTLVNSNNLALEDYEKPFFETLNKTENIRRVDLVNIQKELIQKIR